MFGALCESRCDGTDGRTDGEVHQNNEQLKKKGLKAAKSFGWRINSQRGEQLRKYFQNASMFVT